VRLNSDDILKNKNTIPRFSGLHTIHNLLKQKSSLSAKINRKTNGIKMQMRLTYSYRGRVYHIYFLYATLKFKQFK